MAQGGVGFARAQGYGFESEKYEEWVNKESVVIVRIEHIEAVNNLEDILSVDGFVVSPYGLSCSLGRSGEFEKPDVIDALKRVRGMSEKMNMTSGFHVIPVDVNDSEFLKAYGNSCDDGKSIKRVVKFRNETIKR